MRQVFKTTNLLEGRQPVNWGRGLGKGWLGGLRGRAFTMTRVIDKDRRHEIFYTYNDIT